MIISILGTSGRERGTQKPADAFYDCKILDKPSGYFHNATHMLIENYDDIFYFIGTKFAIDYQKKLLDFSGKKCEFIEVEDNSLNDIFENVFTLLTKADGQVVLDITHGFRHQPISAIFSATLYRFLNDSDLVIIFAKEEESFKKYEYISLNNYIDISQLSLLLTGFIRTLNFVDTVKIEGFETVSFGKFSKALLSNDFILLESSYKDLITTILRAKKDKRFGHLGELLEKIEDVLFVFKDFKQKELHDKYLIVSRLMFEKNYLLLSLTYLFEALRFYVSCSLYKKGVIDKKAWKIFDKYKLNSDAMSFISQKEFGERYKETYYDRRFPKLYGKNHQLFERVSKEYKILKDLRNDLTHITPEKNTQDIKNSLQKLLKSVGNIIERDLLKDLKK